MSIVRQIAFARIVPAKTAWLLSRADEEKRLTVAWRERMQLFALRNRIVESGMNLDASAGSDLRDLYDWMADQGPGST